MSFRQEHEISYTLVWIDRGLPVHQYCEKTLGLGNLAFAERLEKGEIRSNSEILPSNICHLGVSVRANKGTPSDFARYEVVRHNCRMFHKFPSN